MYNIQFTDSLLDLNFYSNRFSSILDPKKNKCIKFRKSLQSRLMRTNFFLTILFALIAGSASAATAEPFPETPFESSSFAKIQAKLSMTIDELIDLALEKNPTTRQAWWNARRAALLLKSANSEYYPKVNIEAYGKDGREFKYINGETTTFTNAGVDLTMRWLLFDCGERRFSVQAAKAALLAANWQVDWNIQKVIVNVLENAYSVLHAQEVYLAASISLAEAENVHDAAKELNRAGLTPLSDIYTSQAAFSQMKIEKAHKKTLLDIQKGKLAVALGLPADTPIELAPVTFSSLESLLELKQEGPHELIALAMKQRADLHAKQARLEEQVWKEKKIRKSSAPKLHFTGTLGLDQAFRAKTSRARSQHYEFGVRLSIPWFDGFQSIYQSRMAYADTKLSMEELLELQLDISLEVLDYSQTLETARQIMPDAEDDLENSKKAYESILESYKAGKERITEISNAQRQLATARVRYSDIKTRALVALANLAYATGTLAPYTTGSEVE